MIELVVIGATLALAVGASGARLRRRVAAARTFERYARWRSHLFVPSRGTASPRVEGTKDDIPFTLDVVRVRGHVRTRATAVVAKGPGAKVAVVQRSAIGRAIGAARDDDEVPTGIAAFDAAYRLHGMLPAEAREWLEKTLAHLVCLDERRDVWLGSDGATVTLLWGGVEKNPLLLDAARDVVVSLAGWHRPEAPYR